MVRDIYFIGINPWNRLGKSQYGT